MSAEPEPDQINGLTIVRDTIVAPRSAFEAIRTVPAWGLALAIAIFLAALGSYLIAPALQHAMTASWPDMVARSPRLAGLSPERQHAQLAFMLRTASLGWTVAFLAVPFYALVSAVIMFVFDKLGGGGGTLGRYWSASSNIAVITAGFASIVAYAIAAARGFDSFTSMQALANLIPTLSLAAPGAPPKVAALLSAVTPFSLWGMVLAILALRIIGGVRRFQAALAALVILALPGFVAALFR